MAMKNYKKDTLIGNWYEERAPKLKGVVADYGTTSYSTTTDETFSKHSSSSSSSSSSSAGRSRSLLTDEYLKRTVDGKVRSVPDDSWRQKVPAHRSATTEGSWNTSYRVAFERNAVGESKKEGPAGAPSRKPIRSPKRAEACGEVVRHDEDPQNDTAAQRSWLPFKDPALAAAERPPVERPDASYMSVRLGNPDVKSSREMKYRQTTAITRERPTAGQGVWRDE